MGLSHPIETGDPRYPAFLAWAEGNMRAGGDEAWDRAWATWRERHPLAVRPRPKHTPCNPGWPNGCCAHRGIGCAVEDVAGADAMVCHRCDCRWDWT